MNLISKRIYDVHVLKHGASFSLNELLDQKMFLRSYMRGMLQKLLFSNLQSEKVTHMKVSCILMGIISFMV